MIDFWHLLFLMCGEIYSPYIVVSLCFIGMTGPQVHRFYRVRHIGNVLHYWGGGIVFGAELCIQVHFSFLMLQDDRQVFLCGGVNFQLNFGVCIL